MLLAMPFSPRSLPTEDRTYKLLPNYPPVELDIPSLFIFEPPLIQDTATTNLPRYFNRLSLCKVQQAERAGSQPCQTICRQHGRDPDLNTCGLAFGRDHLLLWGLALVAPPQAQHLYNQHMRSRPSQTGNMKRERASSTDPKEFQTTTLCMSLQQYPEALDRSYQGSVR